MGSFESDVNLARLNKPKRAGKMDVAALYVLLDS